jgi:hypothetical protein
VNQTVSEPDSNPDRVSKAREVVVQAKRVLTTFRSYGVGHDARRTATTDMMSAVQRFTAAYGDLALQITSKAYFFDDEPLVVEEREDEATTRPLFVEGIQALVFTAALAHEEVEQLMSLWHIGATARFPEGRSLSTELWDAEFKGIETRVVENFSEGADADDAEGQGKAKHEELTVALMHGMSSASLSGGRTRRGDDLRVVSGADLLPLATADAAALTDDVLDRLAANKRTVIDTLSAEERAALLGELTASTVAAGRAHRTLWRLSADADEGDQAVILDVVGRVTRRFLDDGAIDVLRQGLAQTMMAARLDPARAATLGAFFAPLAADDVVARLVESLRDPARRTDATTVLSFLDARAMGLVLGCLDGVVDDADARGALVELLVRKGTTSDLIVAAIAKQASATAAQTVGVLIDVALRVRPGSLDELLGAALAHPQPQVRSTALSRVTLESVAGVAPLLAAALRKEGVHVVRRELLSLLMRAKSPAIVEPLVALLPRSDVDTSDRQTWVRALATFGPAVGTPAVNAIRRMFEGEKDTDLRASCALALGSIADASVRPLLEAEAKKLLGNKTLKTACAEALKRLDARLAGGRA